MSQQLNRRAFLSAAGLVGLSATLPSLAACSSGGTTGQAGAAASAKLTLPAYVPARVAAPDLQGNDLGLDPAYLNYPTNLVRSVATAPGDGSRITALTETFDTPPPSMGSNAYWQALNKALGSELDMIISTDAGDGYPAKFNTVIAGGDIPDLVWFPPNQNLQHVPELLKAKFTDLTKLLSGDAVKAYPNLANLPPYAWKTAVVNGGIWGVPVAYGRMGQVYLFNDDYWKPVGGAAFTGAEDFLAKAKQLLDLRRNKYVLEPAHYNHFNQYALWHGAPTKWRLENGRLTHLYETDEWMAGLEFGVRVAQAKLFWPDATIDTATTMDKLQQGQLGAYVQSYPGYLMDSKQYDMPLTCQVPFAAVPGATPSWNFGYGSVGFTAISAKADPKRVAMLLNVLNYLCAPFGTEERLLIDNGVEGTHFTRSGGSIQLTAKGNAEVVSTTEPLHFLANGPEYINIPGKPQLAQKIHAASEKLVRIAKADPTTGYYSATYVAKGATLLQNMQDLVQDIGTLRKPLSAYKQGLADWRSGGGDQMRHEYEQALAKG